MYVAIERRTDHLGGRGGGATGARGGGPRARAVEAARGRRGRRCHGRRTDGGARKKRAVVSRIKTNRRRREEEEGGGVRRGRRGADRSAPGAGGYIPGRFTPGASHQPGVKVLYSRCVLPTGSKGLFTPGACYQPGVKVLPTGSKGIPLLPVGNTHQE